MNRDRRLTGYLRGQTDIVEPPVGFEVNNPWRVSRSRSYAVVMLTSFRWREDFIRLMGLNCSIIGSVLHPADMYSAFMN